MNGRELTRLWDVLDEYSNQDVSNIIKLLLLTGSRKSEVITAKWMEFDLQKGIWSKPSHSTKQKKFEHVPLSSEASQLLINMKKSSKSPLLFPGKLEGNPINTIKKSWHTIRTKAGLADVRIHDLRHTYASHLVSSGLSLSIVGKLLGHTQASTTQRYAHLADEPLRAATEVFGKKVGRIKVKPKP